MQNKFEFKHEQNVYRLKQHTNLYEVSGKKYRTNPYREENYEQMKHWGPLKRGSSQRFKCIQNYMKTNYLGP